MRRCLACAWFALAFTAHSAGQPTDPAARSVTRIVLDDLGVVYTDGVGFFTAPFSFDGEDWTRAAVGAVATAAVMAMDEPLNALLVSNPPPEFLSKPFEWAVQWGNLRTMQFASLGVYAGGLATGSDAVRVTGRLMGEALLLAGLPAITLQYALGRSRPYSGKGAWDYNFFEWSNEHQSFPSGHSTVAFGISTVLAKRIDRTWASIPLYTAAGLTALSLAWTDQHWASDLLIGAALGYLAGSYVVDREEERSRDALGKGRGERSRFGIGLGRGGVTMRYRIY